MEFKEPDSQESASNRRRELLAEIDRIQLQLREPPRMSLREEREWHTVQIAKLKMNRQELRYINDWLKAHGKNQQRLIEILDGKLKDAQNEILKLHSENLQLRLEVDRLLKRQ